MLTYATPELPQSPFVVSVPEYLSPPSSSAPSSQECSVDSEEQQATRSITSSSRFYEVICDSTDAIKRRSRLKSAVGRSSTERAESTGGGKKRRWTAIFSKGKARVSTMAGSGSRRASIWSEFGVIAQGEDETQIGARARTTSESRRSGLVVLKRMWKRASASFRGRSLK